MFISEKLFQIWKGIILSLITFKLMFGGKKRFTLPCLMYYRVYMEIVVGFRELRSKPFEIAFTLSAI